jgi:Zn-dependent protease/CBS domain-containing protein
MKWSLKLGEVAGIAIFVHATFTILLVWIALAAWIEGRSLSAVFESVVFIVSLFGCVVLHELGHALTARRFGVRTRDITLLPIGGVARLERMPEKPSEELLVALAGPAVNVVIAVILTAGLMLAGAWQPAVEISLLKGPFFQRLLMVNVFIAAFNLLPAFPMDGGRALRALLAKRMGYAPATQLAAHVGQAMALLFGLLGLLGNPFLVLIALFVWIGAAAESSVVQMKAALAGVPVADAMLTRFQTVSSTDSLARAIQITLAGSQKDFPVVDAGRLRGMLTQSTLLSAVAESGTSERVASHMSTDVEVVDSYEMLECVLDRLIATTLPVTHDDAVVGLLTADNIAEFLQIQTALSDREKEPQQSARSLARIRRSARDGECNEHDRQSKPQSRDSGCGWP